MKILFTTEMNGTTPPTNDSDTGTDLILTYLGFALAFGVLLVVFLCVVCVGCSCLITLYKIRKNRSNVLINISTKDFSIQTNKKRSKKHNNEKEKLLEMSESNTYATVFEKERSTRQERLRRSKGKDRLMRSLTSSMIRPDPSDRSRVSSRAALPPPGPVPMLIVHERTSDPSRDLENSPIMEEEGAMACEPGSILSPGDGETELKQQLREIGIEEINQDQLNFEKAIGEGNFSQVYKATWNFPNDQSETVSAHVAVKVMEGTPEERVKFLQEAVLMGQFNDPNIISIFAVVIKPEKLMLVCELMDQDLKSYLIKCRTRIQNGEMSDGEKGELPALLLSYCRKVASSFVYLGLKGFVHRDLAARNILVSSEGDCKIADFGMSREIQDDNDYYKSHGGLVPVKWTALEAIMFRKYSTKSDVWSYGILLYEIWSLGQKPYEGLNNQELIRKVQTGYRLPPPPGCPRSIYELLIKCTHPQPESRPTFTNILVSLQRPDYQLLKWADSDVLGRNLGDPLRDGEHLYTDLQNTYKGETAESNF